MKIWRPKDPKSVALIKLVLWAALVTWMIFTLAIGITMARWGAIEVARLLGANPWTGVWTWIVPIWIIFTTLMLDWAVARFAIRRLRKKEKIEEE